MNKYLKDGILRVGEHVFKLAKHNVEDLFKDLKEALIGQFEFEILHDVS